QTRNDVRQARLVMREIVDECAGGNALVSGYSKILVGDRAVPEMNVGRSTIKTDGAKTPALQLQSAITFPSRGGGARPANAPLNIRGMWPSPIVDEFADVGRCEGTKRVGVNRTGEIDPKIIRPIQQTP